MLYLLTFRFLWVSGIDCLHTYTIESIELLTLTPLIRVSSVYDDFYVTSRWSCLCVYMTQMRRVICERLASLMCMNTSETTTNSLNVKVDLSDVSTSNDVKHLDLTLSATAAAAAEQSIGPVERLLASINDMMETRLRSDAQLRHQRDKNRQMMSEWMIAAAVIDRICFIVFSITLVVCSLAFAMLLFFHTS